MEQNDATSSEKLSDDEVIDLFIDGLIDKKGLDIPTEEIKQDLHEKLKNQLLTEIDRSIVAELPDDKLEELTKLASEKGELNPEIIADTVSEANLDVTNITGATMQRFAELYLNNTPNQQTEAQPMSEEIKSNSEANANSAEEWLQLNQATEAKQLGVEAAQEQQAEENPSEEPIVDEFLNSQGDPSKEQIDYISEKMGQRGRTALIAAELTKEDRDNVVREAIDLKLKETSKNHPVITKFPIVGSFVRAGLAAKYRNEARTAVKESGDLSSAFNALELDKSKSDLLNGGTEAVADRAWKALENAGYSSDNQIERVNSRLDQNEKVEKMDEESQTVVKQVLNEYYAGLTSGNQSKEELIKAFDEKLKNSFQGQESISLKTIYEQRDNLEKLVDDPNIQAGQVENYINQHLTLYKASMKEGIYTDKKVEGVVNAVDKAGLAGGILYAISGREARKNLRSALSTAGGAGAVGAAVGAVTGAIRGAEKAKVKLADAEIKAATSPTEAEAESSDQEAGESSETKKARQIGTIFSKINSLKKSATGEEKYLAEIEKLRDRKDASVLVENLNQLLENYDPENDENRSKLLEAYADILARGKFSSEKHVDLIKYNDNRAALEQKLSEVEKQLYGEDPHKVDELLADETSELSKLIQDKTDKLDEDYVKANKLRTRFIIRSALVDATTGAIIGYGAGAAFHHISSLMPEGGVLGALGIENANTDNLKDSNIELVEDADGGYSVQLGNETLIGEGENPGIDFDDTGALTEESKEMLENAGIDLKEEITPHTFENAKQEVSLSEFFNPANKEANNLTEITSRSWITDANGHDQIFFSDTHMDGDGNIIMQVAPSANSNVSLDDMKVVLTPGNGNIDTAITLDVGPDGTVEIPAGSPAASLFDGENFQGGYAEIARETTNGHFDVYSTIGDGRPDVGSITIDNPDATYNTYEYTLNVNGQDYEMTVPENITATARMEALNGIESLKGTGEPIGYESNGEVTGLTTSSGETIEVQHYEHHGGYSDAVDSYFGEKDGVFNSGESVIRAMVGEEGNGLSSGEVDRIFLDKINSGEISEGSVIEEYLKTMGNSPEALVTTRTMMGGFEMDLNGDGVNELIDTQDEINIASDILSRDPEAYDNFVNDTYEMFYEKIEGGNIRFIDYTQEQYQYTTWGVLDKDTNNILQRLGNVGDRQTDGVGIVFTDKDGNSIYDKEIARKLWHLPEGYKLEYISDRLNCIQKTSNGVFIEESTGDEGTGQEGTGNEGTGDEGTGEEGTDINPKDEENLIRIDNDINDKIEEDVGTEELNNYVNPGVDEQDLTEQPSSDDYQGTEPQVVQNEPSVEAEPVKPSAPENDYGGNKGGAHAEEYAPVKPAPEPKPETVTPVEKAPVSEPEVEEALEDLSID